MRPVFLPSLRGGSIPFNERSQHGKGFFPATLEIHWLSIINSVILALLLGGVVMIIVVRRTKAV
jgi:transmembrane 9 superfamily protein 1